MIRSLKAAKLMYHSKHTIDSLLLHVNIVLISTWYLSFYEKAEVPLLFRPCYL